MFDKSSPGITILSNKDFWDPKNIQSSEEIDSQSISNKPNINVESIVINNSTGSIECTSNVSEMKDEVYKLWMKIKEKEMNQ